ncbi:MAG: hypothetical protein HLUCCA13_15035 [Halomonas sp. HL-48]|nr:MAG: hypothetical protein HLUCCA13_15035 [Halomonas sp. HL-48]
MHTIFTFEIQTHHHLEFELFREYSPLLIHPTLLSRSLIFGYSVTDRDAYSGVKAYWNDTHGAERKTILAGTEENAKQLRPNFATEDDALTAARAEWQRIQRGLAEFELTLALGRADILLETPLTLSGYKPQIDATAWLVTEVEHSFNDGGLGRR